MKASLGKYRKTRGRKITVEISPEDTWGLDFTLALVILPALIQLRQTKNGVPNDFAEVGGEDWSSQESFDFYKETYDESFNHQVEEWDTVMDKMIWSFQQIAIENYDSKYHHGKHDVDWVPSGTMFNPVTGKNEACAEMVDKDPNGHWYDYEGHQEHERRIQEGIDLFAKYFRNLWD